MGYDPARYRIWYQQNRTRKLAQVKAARERKGPYRVPDLKGVRRVGSRRWKQVQRAAGLLNSQRGVHFKNHEFRQWMAKRNTTRGQVSHGTLILEVSDAAYLAGLIDGEGTIGLWINHPKNHRVSYKPLVEISNTHLGVLEWVMRLIGGGWLQQTNKRNVERKGHKPLYRFRFHTRDLHWMLPQIRPYLKIKPVQADLLMEYFQRVENTRPHIGSRDELEQVYLGIRALNQRGTSGSS